MAFIASNTAALAQTSSYRVKFKKTEFLELVEIAQPPLIYKVKRIHFFSYQGFVMYTKKCKSSDFTQKIIQAVEFSNTQWAES